MCLEGVRGPASFRACFSSEELPDACSHVDRSLLLGKEAGMRWAVVCQRILQLSTDSYYTRWGSYKDSKNPYKPHA